MTDLMQILGNMHRPRLLLDAARHGISDYNRARVLKRFTKGQGNPSPQGAVNTLLTVEAGLEAARQSGDASYNVARHVEVMVALLAEARMLARPRAA